MNNNLEKDKLTEKPKDYEIIKNSFNDINQFLSLIIVIVSAINLIALKSIFYGSEYDEIGIVIFSTILLLVTVGHKVRLKRGR